MNNGRRNYQNQRGYQKRFSDSKGNLELSETETGCGETGWRDAGRDKEIGGANREVGLFTFLLRRPAFVFLRRGTFLRMATGFRRRSSVLCP